MKEGKGKLTLPSGKTYEGDWKEDAPNGKGKEIDEYGNIYEGDWKDGEKQEET